MRIGMALLFGLTGAAGCNAVDDVIKLGPRYNGGEWTPGNAEASVRFEDAFDHTFTFRKIDDRRLFEHPSKSRS